MGLGVGILQLADVPFSLRDILEPSVFRWLSGLCMVSRKGVGTDVHDGWHLEMLMFK